MNKTITVKSSARDVFSYLLLIAMFIVGVVSFLTLVFQYVNLQFPDVLDSWWREGALQAMRGSISAIIVAWPVTILMFVFVGRDLRSDVNKQYIWIRKWLLHLMLFISAIAIIIDLITLINFFLNGEISIRFVYKVVAVLAVATAVFWYNLWELRRDPLAKTKVTRLAAIVSSVVIVGFIVASLFVAGSPTQQRNVRLDSQRISDLQSIQSGLMSYWIDKEKLPDDLNTIEDDLVGYRNPLDPKTEASYEYKKTGDLSFSLCAEFATQTEEPTTMMYSTPMYFEYGYSDVSFQIWSHPSGHYCFDRTIDPERFEDKQAY